MNGRLRFIAGEQRQFAEKCINKMNEQEFEEEPQAPSCPQQDNDCWQDGCCGDKWENHENECTDDCVNDDQAWENCENDLRKNLHNDNEITLRHDKMCFHEGCDDELEMEESYVQQDDQFNLRRPPQRPQNPAMMAKEIYVKLLTLRQMYRALRNFNTKYSPELDEMIEELNVITFAMGRIYQTLSRSRTLPPPSQRRIQMRDFCQGLSATSRFLREILFDLRRLQRAVDNQNISTQLLIINITLMSHQQQLGQMQQECR